MKKQSFITILLTVLMNMVGAKVFAYDIAVENADGVTIYYNYINDGKELEVTCYSMGNSLAGPWSTYAGNVIIPSEVTYVNRTRSVTSIGYSAFISCRNLTSILIPSSMKSIGNLAFFECDKLTSVTIPNSVTSIGGSAFAGCTRITSVTIPNGVTSISGATFWLCTGLSSVVIPNSVTSIGESAFSGCESLTSVTIPSSVTSIGEYAFAGCTSLSSVHISDLRLWCGIAFADSGSNPLTYAHHLYLNGVEVKDLVIPDSFTSIGNFVFSGCEGLTSVKINNAQIIGDYAFASCTGLPSIVIPEGVIQIGNNAFNNCTGLSSIVIPNGVRTIGSGAFYACTGLLFVTLPNSLTSIGDLAFEGADIPTITSYLENPFSICGKDNSNEIFSTNTFNNATLYVPVGTKDKYMTTIGWKDFYFIEEGTGPSGGDEIPETIKCATPTISYQNGKLTFNCDTEGATCQSTITDTDITSYSSNEVQLGVTYNICVYATKAGYENSDVATATLCWIDVEPKTEGITNIVSNVRARAILIQSSGNQLTISGAEEGTAINVFDISGRLAGSTKASSEITTLNTSLQSGDIGIVKIGDKAVKILAK